MAGTLAHMYRDLGDTSLLLSKRNSRPVRFIRFADDQADPLSFRVRPAATIRERSARKFRFAHVGTIACHQ
jgi:hypothetical protein